VDQSEGSSTENLIMANKFTEEKRDQSENNFSILRQTLLTDSREGIDQSEVS